MAPPRIALLGLALSFGTLAFMPAPARADPATAWFQTEQGKVRIIAGVSGTGQAQSIALGLEFELAPHWKIYWRSPGDAGYPPRLDWSGSENLAAAEMAWPAPERFSVLGLETVGYSGAVVLPIAARLAHPGAPLHLEAQLDYLTCNEICIPYQTTLTLDLPVAGAGPDYGALIAQYQARVPGEGKDTGLALESAALRAGHMPVLDLRVASPAPLIAPDLFVDAVDGTSFGPPRIVPGAAGETILRVPVGGAWPKLLDQPLRVTLVDGARAMTGTVVPRRGTDLESVASILAILGLAALGGLILNLMPCVLPVLSLKLLAALPRPGQSSAAVRRGFLGSALGVVLSFLALGVLAAVLKSAGVAVGWGVQFQNPFFLIFLVAVLALFACNLWGWFDVPLPRAVAALGERHNLGNVAAGAFATLMAIPCSAPFLGTALSFALAAGAIEIILVFLALGLGMALPYLLVAALPRLAAHLPHPGRWMVLLRRGLSLLLVVSAAWLLFVLAGEIGAEPAAIVALLMVVAAASLAAIRDAGPRWTTLAVAVLGALVVPQFAPPPGALPPAQGMWRAFDPGAIGGLVRDGHVVFVDVTADWCLTCKVNERLVLEGASVRQALERPGVVAMRADWTRPDPAIAAYLSRFGRAGIPFNSVYGPGAPGGVALPELLTSGTVTAALDQAAGR